MILLRPPDDEEDRGWRHEAERQAERESEHTPAGRAPGRAAPSPAPVTTAMGVLAWTVLHGTWHDARDASRALAEIVLEALG